jgi:lysozyme
MSILPQEKPKLTRDALHKLLAPLKIDRIKYPIVTVGIRGYYKNMGVAGVNDLQMYDDALFLDLPDATYNYNGNVDPGYVKFGAGKGDGKGMAHLKAGLYFAHQFGMHKGQYEAIIQTGGEVTVTRDGHPNYDDKGYFGINQHKGGYTKTSSEGCQTWHPDQWQDFIDKAHAAGHKYFGADFRKRIIPYVLIENTGQI